MTRRARQGLGRLAVGLLAWVLAGCSSLPVELDEKPGIDRVYERHRSAAQLERAGQTLSSDGPEEGSDAIFLSDPKSRAGYQFEVTLDGSVQVPAGSSFRVEMVRQEGQPPQVRDFPVTRQPGWFFGEYVLRFSGADDPGPRWRPVAWRISLLGPDGKALAVRRSFLWGAPNDVAPR